MPMSTTPAKSSHKARKTVWPTSANSASRLTAQHAISHDAGKSACQLPLAFAAKPKIAAVFFAAMTFMKKIARGENYADHNVQPQNFIRGTL
jgi:hypothetical protein